MSFDKRASTWDASSRRQELAKAVADKIKSSGLLNPGISLLDVGAGTGLLARRLLPYVAKITGVDSSKGMIDEFSKIGENAVAIHSDILEYDSTSLYGGIVSSMTMHHIEDIDALFEKLFFLLEPGGFIAMADLEKEDGSFHDGGNEGVYHFGFDEESLKAALLKAGFEKISLERVYEVEKEKRSYPVFLLTARKPDGR